MILQWHISGKSIATFIPAHHCIQLTVDKPLMLHLSPRLVRGGVQRWRCFLYIRCRWFEVRKCGVRTWKRKHVLEKKFKPMRGITTLRTEYLWQAPWRGPMESITSGSTDICVFFCFGGKCWRVNFPGKLINFVSKTPPKGKSERDPSLLLELQTCHPTHRRIRT